MARLSAGESQKFNVDPVDTVDYHLDLDYTGDAMPAQRLDVIVPRGATAPLPVYMYFHGGGWTSGDKTTLTRYCAVQALGGMVVVNVNYRMAPRFHMQHMIEDAHAALHWVARTIADFGGDPTRIVLGGDSAGGQLSALLAASLGRPELADHYGVTPTVAASSIRGVVQHCSISDFSVIFERGFVLGLGFVRMLLPRRGRGVDLQTAARYLSPIEWLDGSYPPVFVTTSRRDQLFRASMNFIAALRGHGVAVESHIDETAMHTWQQNSHHPASVPVYRRLQQFVRTVTAPRFASV
jgi:acetyl esterase/lipase